MQRAKDAGLRSRAAFKLEEIDAAEKLFSRAPSWLTSARRRAAGASTLRGGSPATARCLRSTCCRWTRSPASSFQQGDFREQAALDALLAELGGRRVDLVMSDMAPNMSGVDVVDQARAADLEALALDFARQVLRPGGVLVMKVFQGAGFQQLLAEARRAFEGPHAQAQGVEAAQFQRPTWWPGGCVRCKVKLALQRRGPSP